MPDVLLQYFPFAYVSISPLIFDKEYGVMKQLLSIERARLSQRPFISLCNCHPFHSHILHKTRAHAADGATTECRFLYPDQRCLWENLCRDHSQRLPDDSARQFNSHQWHLPVVPVCSTPQSVALLVQLLQQQSDVRDAFEDRSKQTVRHGRFECEYMLLYGPTLPT